MKPIAIREHRDVYEYLTSRGLVTQYQKAKMYILSGLNTRAYFQERAPKGCGIWYFRINRKYRAIGEFRGEIFLVSHIDDHQ